MDSGDSYQLYLELSDNTCVIMNGYDTHPDSWNELFSDVTEIFERNKDYSRYMAQNFTDSPCTVLHAKFYEGSGTRTSFKLEYA